MQVLTRDLVKYCDQIGIPQNERPTIVWDKPTFRTLTQSTRVTRRTMGYAHYESNTILVDLAYKAKQVWRRTYHGKKHLAQYDKVRFGLSKVRHTLVHELVHMRWQNLRHGYYFEKRIKDILSGMKFEQRADKDLTNWYIKGRAARQAQLQPSPLIEAKKPEPTFPRPFESVPLKW